jgi:transposase
MELLTDPRFLRGLDIARRGGVRSLRRQVWAVNSASHAGSYLVDLAAEIPACTCPDHEEHGGPEHFRCKHVFAALVHAKKIEIPAGLMMITDTQARQTYAQNWPAYEAAQQHEREHFETLLRDLCGGVVNPVQQLGRPRKPLADVVFAAVLRSYTGMSSRRATSDVRAAHEAGMIDEMISPKTLIRYLDDPTLTDLLRTLIRESASPLANVESRFAVDSSGFSTCTYARWFDHKWGRERRKQRWVKAHVCVGVSTHIISDVVITGSDGGDAPQLPELVANTAGRFTVAEVSGDKAYASFRNYDAIESVGAVPYIAFKNNTTGEGPALWRKMWGLYTYKNDEFRRHYHARSNVETAFSMIKRKFGASLRAKNETAQHNETLCKLLAHNLCVLVASMYELNVAAEFWKQPSKEVGHVG